MRKDFKFPSPPDSGLADIELPEEDQGDVPVTPVTPRMPNVAPPVPAPPLLPTPTIVVHAAKDSMNRTQRVDLPEVVLPDSPTPNSAGEPETAWWMVYQAWEGGRARTILGKPLKLS